MFMHFHILEVHKWYYKRAGFQPKITSRLSCSTLLFPLNLFRLKKITTDNNRKMTSAISWLNCSLELFLLFSYEIKNKELHVRKFYLETKHIVDK